MKYEGRSEEGQKPSIVLPVVIVGLLIVGGAVAYRMFQSTPPPAAAPAETPGATVAPGQKEPVAQAVAPREDTAEAAAPVAVAPPVEATPSPVQVSRIKTHTDSRVLMTALTSLGTNGPITADDAQKWKDSLQQLVHQGASSVGAIQEYLAQNQDISFAGVAGADQLGYSSLRAGLLNALGQIGGPEATAAMLQTLQTTAFPSDIATLATTLGQQAPGQYDGQVLSAVRAQLALAAQDQLGGANVGPLFQMALLCRDRIGQSPQRGGGFGPGSIGAKRRRGESIGRGASPGAIGSAKQRCPERARDHGQTGTTVRHSIGATGAISWRAGEPAWLRPQSTRNQHPGIAHGQWEPGFLGG
jgi:hypothetical protein